MSRFLLRAKIHGAVVTETHLDYEGSLSLDEALMEAADLVAFEQVHVYNLSNGERFVTYLIKGEKGSGVVGVNGAAVHKVSPGDRLIIASYSAVEEREIPFFTPRIVLLDDANRRKKC